MVNNKTALVFGGTGGLGSYIVDQFFKENYRVAFTYFGNNEKAMELEKKVSGKAYRTDVSNEDSVKELKENIAKEYGCLNVVVYCVGIFKDSLVNEMSLESWNQVQSTNLTGAFLAAKYLIQMLRESGNGRFICIGSVMGESGIYGSCSYAASKAGLIGLVKSIALENAKFNVTANVVSLGYINTGMTNQVSEKVLDSAIKKIPMKRLGNPDDTAKVIVDLCREHTNYISGQIIRVNGLLYV